MERKRAMGRMMVLNVFLNHRRADSEGWAESLYRALKNDAPEVFMDLDGDIPPGWSWSQWIDSKLEQSDAMVSLIGKNWVDELQRRQSGDEPDYVVAEIARALKRGIPVVPVLLGDASLPDRRVLPEEIRSLVAGQAVRVRRLPDFDSDVRKLIDGLNRAVALMQARDAGDEAPGAADPSRRFVARAVGVGGVALLGGGSLAYWLWRPRSPLPDLSNISIKLLRVNFDRRYHDEQTALKIVDVLRSANLTVEPVDSRRPTPKQAENWSKKIWYFRESDNAAVGQIQAVLKNQGVELDPHPYLKPVLDPTPSIWPPLKD